MKTYLHHLIAFVALFHLWCCNTDSTQNHETVLQEKFEISLDSATNKDLPNSRRKINLVRAYNYNRQLRTDSLKAAQYGELARAAISVSDSTMFRLSNGNAAAMAQALNNRYLQADAQWNTAEFYLSREVYDSAYINYRNAHSLFTEAENDFYAAKMFYNMAYIKARITDYTGCEILLFRAMETFKELQKEKQIFLVYNLLGSVYDDLKEYERSLEYYDKALSIYPQTNETRIKQEDLENNIGLVYQKMGKQVEAIRTFDRALENKTLRNGNPELYARLLDNRTYSAFLIASDTVVLRGFQQALKIRDSLNNTAGKVMSYLHLGNYFLAESNRPEALLFARSAYELSDKIDLTRDKLASLQLLAKIDKIKSTAYLQEYIAINDSLMEMERKTRDKFARIHFETDEYIKANEKLFKEKVVLAAAAIVVTALLLFVFITMNQRNRNKQLKLEAEQQRADEAIYSMRIDQLKQSEKARQEERERIAEELHDSVLGQLYGIRVNWEFQDLEDENGVTITKQEQLNNLLKVEKEIRNLSHNLVANIPDNPTHILENFRTLLKEKSELGQFKYHFKCSEGIDWEEIDEYSKLNLYRIIEEALHNIVKHSGASKVELTIIEKDGSLSITIIDNGKGFGKMGNKKGIGLRNMRSRAKKIGAVLTIQKREKGVAVLIKLKNFYDGREKI